MERELQITQVMEIGSSTLKVSFFQTAITRLINQGIIRLGSNKAFFNDQEINIQDYILFNRNGITILTPQTFDFIFKDSNLSASVDGIKPDTTELEEEIEKLKASNARQITTITQLQDVLNEYKSKNDSLRQRLSTANQQQERLIISRQQLKEENIRLQKIVHRFDEKDSNIKENVSKEKPKKPLKKIKTQKVKTSSAKVQEKKTKSLSERDEKRFEKLRKMSKEELNKVLNIDDIPVKERFDRRKDLRILALKASSKAELARWLYRGRSTIKGWIKVTKNKEILDHFKA